MTRQFYEVLDQDLPGRWHLDEPLMNGERFDFWPLVSGTQVKEADFLGVEFGIQYPGEELSFNLAPFGIPVLDSQLAEDLEVLVGSQCQRVPARVLSAKRGYEILVVTERVACLDRSRSDYELWTEDDSRPDKIGEIRALYERNILASAVPDHLHLFRLSEWDITIVVSAQARVLLERVGATGVHFVEI